MAIDIAETLAALDALNTRTNEAMRQSVADGLHLIQATAMAKAPRGTPGNSTNLPGDLARSIEVTGPRGRGARGLYVGWVGPTTVYGRLRELGSGNGIFPVRARMLHFFKFGEEVFTYSVHQKAEPYLKPAVDENLMNILAIGIARLKAAESAV